MLIISLNLRDNKFFRNMHVSLMIPQNLCVNCDDFYRFAQCNEVSIQLPRYDLVFSRILAYSQDFTLVKREEG
jgi:hypothetical protein